MFLRSPIFINLPTHTSLPIYLIRTSRKARTPTLLKLPTLIGTAQQTADWTNCWTCEEAAYC